MPKRTHKPKSTTPEQRKPQPGGDPRPGASGKLKEIPGARKPKGAASEQRKPRPATPHKLKEIPGTPRAVHGPQRPPGRPLFGVARLRAVLKHSADVSVAQLCEEAATLLKVCREHLPGAKAHLWPDDDDPWSRHP